ncbi:MAG: hypothetical protein RR829_05315, partial [Oscillospiraceae bacterium]
AMCSGDPASLDGVYIPALKTAYMDGTAPHIADARITAVDSAYLDLGVFYDISAISEYRPELNLLRKSTGALHKKAYTLLHAEGVCGATGKTASFPMLKRNPPQNALTVL